MPGPPDDRASAGLGVAGLALSVLLWYCASAVSGTSSKRVLAAVARARVAELSPAVGFGIGREAATDGAGDAGDAASVPAVAAADGSHPYETWVTAEVPLLLCIAQFAVASLVTAGLMATGVSKWRAFPRPALPALVQMSACFSFGFASLYTTVLYVQVSLAEVLRAAEPLFSLALTMVALRGASSGGGAASVTWEMALALLVIVCGVGLSSGDQVDLTLSGMAFASVSNVMFAARSVVAKRMVATARAASPVYRAAPVGSVPTMFVVTSLGCMMLSVLVGTSWLVRVAVSGEVSPLPLIPRSAMTLATVYPNGLPAALSWVPEGLLHAIPAGGLLLNGLAFFLYNQLSYVVLSNVHVLTHAVANALRRVVTILFAIAMFGNPVSVQNKVGIALSVAGSLAYSVAKHRAQKLVDEAAATAAARAAATAVNGGPRAAAAGGLGSGADHAGALHSAESDEARGRQPTRGATRASPEGRDGEARSRSTSAKRRARRKE